MKKIILTSVIILVSISIGLFIFITSNPPLVIGTVGTSKDKHTVMVEIGNKGFRDVRITNVLINNNELP
ncbi:hypothetical protein [Robertmurraya sp. P23]|uniref:hypothetical protein n=1 Tax=Robertmurraya sp. P23 TaxID=3436931 RepID=UPI003D9722A8